MNIIIAVLLIFALIGAADEAIGGRMGVAEEFRRGISMMGSLCFSMTGFYCAAVTVMPAFAERLAGVPLPFDASLPAGLLLACDMGGWASAAILAQTPEFAVYSGLLAASTIGCLLSFVLPVTLGTLQPHETMGFMQGVVWGIVALPAGLALGGLVLGMQLPVLLRNLWPVILLCVLFCIWLRFAAHSCIGFLVAAGALIRWLGIVLFCIVGFGIFVPQYAAVNPERVSEVLMIVLRITLTVCGSLVASRLLLTHCGRWIDRASKLLGINDYAVLGLMAGLVSSLSMLPFYSRMDVRGKVMNAAFTVSGVFVLGGQMAFAASVTDGRGMAAYFVTKLAGGILALLLASVFTKSEECRDF